MRDKIKDIDRLRHMLQAIDDLQTLTGEQWTQRIQDDPLMFFALVKLLEIVGEAAYMITKDFKSEHADLYWQAIEDMRHVMVHGYYKIDLKRLIQTVNDDIPFIRSKIVAYINEISQ